MDGIAPLKRRSQAIHNTCPWVTNPAALDVGVPKQNICGKPHCFEELNKYFNVLLNKTTTNSKLLK